MNKKSVAFGFLRFAGRFYKWAFGSIFRLVKKSNEHIRAIENKKRETAIERNFSSAPSGFEHITLNPQHPIHPGNRADESPRSY